VELDKYLGAFNTIELVHRDGFLSDDHLCASFSFYIKEANPAKPGSWRFNRLVQFSKSP
jgi:hypothetical protein